MSTTTQDTYTFLQSLTSATLWVLRTQLQRDLHDAPVEFVTGIMSMHRDVTVIINERLATVINGRS